MLIFGRIVVGTGIGLSSGTVPVYISEVSPAKARGWQVSLFQLAITVGILLAYLVGRLCAAMQGWRWMLGLAVVPAGVFGAGMFFLAGKSKMAREAPAHEARRPANCLTRIRGTEDVDAELLEEIEAQSGSVGGARPLLRSARSFASGPP